MTIKPSATRKTPAGPHARTLPKINDKALSESTRRLQDEQRWELRLYVTGLTPNCLLAINNLRKICEQHMAGKYDIQVIDLLKDPRLSFGDQILAVPTLVRKFPMPVRRIIGDLSDTEQVLIGLDLRPGIVR